MMQTEQGVEHVIGQLVSGLQPVRRRTVGGDALVLGVLLGVELALVLAFGAMRPDMPDAARTMSFWWKLLSLGAMALLGGGVALLSLDPARSPRRGLRAMLPIAAACLAAGWAIDAAHDGWPTLLTRLDWPSGVQCAGQIVALSLPAAVVLGMLMRRGAPTDANGSALAAGLAAAGWGAFAFVFYCPYDDPLYVVAWYGLGCGAVATAARLVLPRMARW